MIPWCVQIYRRLTKGQRWVWSAPEFREWITEDLDRRVMEIESSDRLHRKQGRSTCRLELESSRGRLRVYLKRHERLSVGERIAGIVHFEGRHTPAGVEWRHLELARRLGIRVPTSVAAGERVERGGSVKSYLMIRELAGEDALHEVIPRAARTLPTREFRDWKRRMAGELAEVTCRLHRACAFHKDLYLCHFFVPVSDAGEPGKSVTLIDLHRLRIHPWTSWWWRWKDLGQLLYSTVGVEGIEPRDLLRFWRRYRRGMGIRWPRVEAWLIEARAARYLKHNDAGVQLGVGRRFRNPSVPTVR